MFLTTVILLLFFFIDNACIILINCYMFLDTNYVPDDRTIIIVLFH